MPVRLSQERRRVTMSPTEIPSPKRILVADDERHVVRLIESALVKAGHEVIAAYEPLEAYEKARSEQPDLIILDNWMPYNERIDGFPPGQESGVGLIQLLRADASLSATPIILMTAMPPSLDVVPKYEGLPGPVSFLIKPFEPHCLPALVAETHRGKSWKETLAERFRGREHLVEPERCPWWRFWSR
jgi:CheY-like chemotaxis protein